MLGIYAIYDKQSKVYSSISTFNTDGVAMRFYADQLRSKDVGFGSVLAAHPDDFSLYRFGGFDELTGTVVSDLEPLKICEFSSLVSMITNDR